MGKYCWCATAISVVLILSGIIFLLLRGHGDEAKTTELPLPAVTAERVSGLWQSYESTLYHYKVSYPVEGRIYTIPASTLAKESRDVSIKGQGWGGVKISPLTQEDPSLTPYQKQALSLDVKSFAEFVRNAQADFLSNSDSGYDTGRHASELKSTLIGGRQAYGFSIEIAANVWPFSTALGPAGNSVVNYFIVANLNDTSGTKFIVAYPADDPIAQKIVDSIQFTN